jgi:hypothetical protein
MPWQACDGLRQHPSGTNRIQHNILLIRAHVDLEVDLALKQSHICGVVTLLREFVNQAVSESIQYPQMKQANEGMFECWNMSPVVYHERAVAGAAIGEFVCMRMTNCAAQTAFVCHPQIYACGWQIMLVAVEQENECCAFSIHGCT